LRKYEGEQYSAVVKQERDEPGTTGYVSAQQKVHIAEQVGGQQAGGNPQTDDDEPAQQDEPMFQQPFEDALNDMAETNELLSLTGESDIAEHERRTRQAEILKEQIKATEGAHIHVAPLIVLIYFMTYMSSLYIYIYIYT